MRRFSWHEWRSPKGRARTVVWPMGVQGRAANVFVFPQLIHIVKIARVELIHRCLRVLLPHQTLV